MFRKVLRRRWKDSGQHHPWHKNQVYRFLYPVSLRPLPPYLPVIFLAAIFHYFPALPLREHLQLCFPPSCSGQFFHRSDHLPSSHPAAPCFHPSMPRLVYDHHFHPAALHPVSFRPALFRRPADLFSFRSCTGTLCPPGSCSVNSLQLPSGIHNTFLPDRSRFRILQVSACSRKRL